MQGCYRVDKRISISIPKLLLLLLTSTYPDMLVASGSLLSRLVISVGLALLRSIESLGANVLSYIETGIR